MAKHKAKMFEFPQGYLSWGMTKAYNDFAQAVRSGDLELAKSLRLRGRKGSLVRHWSELIANDWKVNA